MLFFYQGQKLMVMFLVSSNYAISSCTELFNNSLMPYDGSPNLLSGHSKPPGIWPKFSSPANPFLHPFKQKHSHSFLSSAEGFHFHAFVFGLPSSWQNELLPTFHEAHAQMTGLSLDSIEDTRLNDSSCHT